MTSYVLAIDQGTTSSRAILFRADTSIAAMAQQEFPQHFPADGQVEHEPEDLWTTTRRDLPQRAAQCRRHGQGHRRHRHHQSARDHAAVGSRQRAPGASRHRLAGPAHRRHLRAPQGRRSRSDIRGQDRTCCSILISPAPSSPGCWSMLRASRDARERGELAFGTVDTYLLWRLTGGKVHATDATNASRTLLFDIHAGRWDDELLKLLGVPKAVLPEVLDSSAAFGVTDPELFGAAIPICGIAGDQQAALIGQACFAPGMLKSTYGTGCFALLNTGETPVASKTPAADDHRLPAWRRAPLCARGLDLRRRRRGAVAARQLARRAERARRPARSPTRPTPRRRSFWFRLSSVWARPIGGRTCAARSSA